MEDISIDDVFLKLEELNKTLEHSKIQRKILK